MTEAKPVDPRYKYARRRAGIIKQEYIEGMIKIVLEAGTGTWASILAGLKLMVIWSFIGIMKSLEDDQILISQNEYQQDQGNNNQDEIDNEDKDGL